MNTQHRKELPTDPQQPTAQDLQARQQRQAHQSELLDEAIIETFPASDAPDPDVVLDDGDVESVEGGNSVVGTRDIESPASASDVEWVGTGNAGDIELAAHSPPDPIDPGSDGEDVI